MVVEESDDYNAVVVNPEASIMLRRKVKAFEGKVGLAPTESPDYSAVLPRDFVDGARVAGRYEVVTVVILVYRVDVVGIPRRAVSTRTGWLLYQTLCRVDMIKRPPREDGLACLDTDLTEAVVPMKVFPVSLYIERSASFDSKVIVRARRPPSMVLNSCMFIVPLPARSSTSLTRW